MRISKTVAVVGTSLMLAVAASACSRGADASAATSAARTDTFVERGSFSGDTAMEYARRQVKFGPRVPGTEAHGRCAEWLVTTLRGHGADTVRIIESKATAWDGTPLPVRNIFAQYNPEAKARVILLAHYDTRPWADQELDASKRNVPIDGANDGASGVAVLLEIARNLAKAPAGVGVDILLTDCEDYGARNDTTVANESESWCIGSRHFASNLPYEPGYMPRYGMLLDMVGGRDARFNREYLSATLAQAPTAKVWAMAARLGLDKRFPQQIGGGVTDDHLPLIEAGIPVTDIIENSSTVTGGFPATWHTHNDNIDNLDPATMEAVGRVVLNVIYNEKP